MEFRVITRRDALPHILNKHYAKRCPSISYAYGVFSNNTLKGIITYGCPASSPLKKGICGVDNKNIVIELNRLCIDDDMPRNTASQLIAYSFKNLPKPLILVSYADTEQNHIGYVYQATNWIYTGLSAKRTDWKIKGMENLHGQTIADISRGQKNRAKYMRDRFGDDFYLKERSRKHRYVYFIGTKRQVKYYRSKLKYKVFAYPKQKKGCVG